MKRLRTANVNIPEFYNRGYRDDFNGEIDFSIDSERQELMTRYFKGGKLLDLGCGILGICVNTKKKFTEAEVWGLDFSDETIESLRKIHPEINYVSADCRDNPFRDEYFDYITAGELIEHMEKPEEFLKEVFRVLKRGGVLSLSTPLNCSIDGAHLWEFTEEDIKNMLKPFGKIETVLFNKETWDKVIAFCIKKL